MRKKIGIIGYGALGKQIENFIIEEQGKDVPDIYYFDDILYQTSNSKAFKFGDFNDNKFHDFAFYVCLGYHHLAIRREICQQLLHNKFELPSFIHKTSYVSSKAIIGQGVLVFPMCNIDQFVRIEDGVIVNNSTTISHNSTIGTCSFIAPGVTLSGNVKIGKLCFVGTGSVVADSVTVGENVRVGIGSNITKDIDDGLSVIGNPFKIMSKNLKL